MKWLGPNWIKVDLDAVYHNLMTIKNLTSAQVCPVLKGDAYGHGIVVLSMFLQQFNPPYIAVSDLDEALEVRSVNSHTPVLVLTPILPEQAEVVADHNITATVANSEVITALAQAASVRRKVLPVHLKINTGMNRVGVAVEQAVTIAQQITQHHYLKLVGVYTHFAAASTDQAYTRLQWQRFLQVKHELEKRGFQQLLWHAANSAALIKFPESHMDLVRTGTLLFGQSVVELPDYVDLHCTWQLFSRIIQVNHVSKGESIGYDQTYTTKRDSIIGVIPIGYGDGIGFGPNQQKFKQQIRSFLVHLVNNPNRVWIGETSYPIVGKIAMGMSCIDLTDYPHPEELYGAIVQVPARRTTINRRVPKLYYLHGKLVLVYWHNKIWKPLTRNGLMSLKEINAVAAKEFLKWRNVYDY